MTKHKTEYYKISAVKYYLNQNIILKVKIFNLQKTENILEHIFIVLIIYNFIFIHF